METSSVEDGAWTLNVRHKRGSVWTAWIARPSVLDPRFQRARFTLDDEPADVISADQLRAALGEWLADPNGHSMLPVKIDIEASTVNGASVLMHREA